MRTKKLFQLAAFMLFLMIAVSCTNKDDKVWGWVSGSLSMQPEQLEHYFSKCKEVGIDAIIMECHGSKPVILDSTTFRDSAALEIIRRAVPYAQKYGIELHAWMWTTNRVELHLREAHPQWYQVNAQGQQMQGSWN